MPSGLFMRTVLPGVGPSGGTSTVDIDVDARPNAPRHDADSGSPPCIGTSTASNQSSGANPRRIVFSQHARGSVKCSR